MDTTELLERLEREPEARWPLLLQRPAYHSPALTEALIDRAVVHRSADRVHCLACAQAAATVAARLPGHFQHLRARALAELGNAHRSQESYDLAAQRIQEAEALLDDHTPIAVRAEVLSCKASLLRDQKLFDAAAGAAELAIVLFDRAGRPLDMARNVVILGHIHSQAGRPRQAKQAYERALGLLLGDERLLAELGEASQEYRQRYWTLVGRVQVNAMLVGVQEAEAEPDPRNRAYYVEASLSELRKIGPNVRDALPPHECLHLDWLWGRLMIADGKFVAAVQALEEVRDGLAREGLLVQSADAGEDLLFAYVAQGDLVRANEQAARMLEIYDEHQLLPDQVAVLKAMTGVRRRYEAARLLRQGRSGALLRSPRRPRGIPL